MQFYSKISTSSCHISPQCSESPSKMTPVPQPQTSQSCQVKLKTQCKISVFVKIYYYVDKTVSFFAMCRLSKLQIM